MVNNKLLNQYRTTIGTGSTATTIEGVQTPSSGGLSWAAWLDGAAIFLTKARGASSKLMPQSSVTLPRINGYDTIVVMTQVIPYIISAWNRMLMTNNAALSEMLDGSHMKDTLAIAAGIPVSLYLAAPQADFTVGEGWKRKVDNKIYEPALDRLVSDDEVVNQVKEMIDKFDTAASAGAAAILSTGTDANNACTEEGIANFFGAMHSLCLELDGNAELAPPTTQEQIAGGFNAAKKATGNILAEAASGAGGIVADAANQAGLIAGNTMAAFLKGIGGYGIAFAAIAIYVAVHL